MTSQNHTGIAICTLAITVDTPITSKLLACGVLMLSHLLLDALPHRHFYDFEKIKNSRKDQIGGLIELGGGMILLPILAIFIFHLEAFWVAAYTLSANGLDILVGLRIGWAKYINKLIHWWEEKFEVADQVVFEVFETLLIFVSIALALGGSL